MLNESHFQKKKLKKNILAPDFMAKKAAQEFFCAVSKVFDRVKTVALWSAKK
jgi:hypothetical protein